MVFFVVYHEIISTRCVSFVVAPSSRLAGDVKTYRTRASYFMLKLTQTHFVRSVYLPVKLQCAQEFCLKDVRARAHTHTHTQARTHAHACTRARTRGHTHTHCIDDRAGSHACSHRFEHSIVTVEVESSNSLWKRLLARLHPVCSHLTVYMAVS